MTPEISKGAAKLLAAIALTFCIVGILYLQSCQRVRTAATEKRTERAQSGATVESAKDAMATQEAAQEREQASEQLTVQNEKDIRNAEGAKVRVAPAVDVAGRRALCLRQSYRDSEQCRMFRADPK